MKENVICLQLINITSVVNATSGYSNGG